MADTIEEAATPIPNNLRSVLGMTVAEYLNTSLHRDLSALSAAPALLDPSILPRSPPVLIVHYINQFNTERQLVILRSKVESWREVVCIYFRHCIAIRSH